MKTLVKILVWGVVALVTVAGLAIAAFVFLFDPNDFRDDITRLVEARTGRELSIQGDLSLSFYPWLGFDAGRTTLSNAPGFGDKPMAEFESASASVKLMPLFKKQVEISRLRVDGLDLTLHSKRDGTTNWDDLVDDEDAAAGASPQTQSFVTQSIGGIELSGARIHYIDEAAAEDYVFSGVELVTGVLVPGEAFDVKFTGDYVSADPAMSGTLGFAGKVGQEEQRWVATDGRLELSGVGDAVPGEEVELVLSGPRWALDGEDIHIVSPVLELAGKGNGDPWERLALGAKAPEATWRAFDVLEVPEPAMTLDMAAESLPGGVLKGDIRAGKLTAGVVAGNLEMSSLSGTLLGLTLTGDVRGSNIYEDNAVYEGKVDIQPFPPTALMARLGIDPLEIADATALTEAVWRSRFRLGSNDLRLDDIVARIDDSRVTGSAAIEDLTTSRSRFDLSIDRINLDRYSPPTEEGSETESSAAALEGVEIPVEDLRALATAGTLRIGDMKLLGLQSNDVTLTINAAGGDVRVNPASAKLYGGQYRGDIGIDVRGPLPVLKMNERLEAVKFGDLTRALFKEDRLTGTLDGRVTLTGTGRDAAAITASFNGDAAFKFADGTYEGTDVWYQVRRARSLLKKEPMSEKADEGRTKFGLLSGTGKVVDGILRSDDITVRLPYLAVNGGGTMNLLSQEIDFRFEGAVLDRPELDAGMNEYVGITLPVLMTGTLAEPSVRVDYAGALGIAAKNKVKEKIEDKLRDKLGLGSRDAGAAATGAEGEVPAEGAAAEKPPNELEAKKQELEKKADDIKDKLKGLFGGGSL